MNNLHDKEKGVKGIYGTTRKARVWVWKEKWGRVWLEIEIVGEGSTSMKLGREGVKKLREALT